MLRVIAQALGVEFDDQADDPPPVDQDAAFAELLSMIPERPNP
jgi:hypothetical protein